MRLPFAELERDVARPGRSWKNGAVNAKVRTLQDAIAAYGSVAIAYSGGADSAFLVDVAHETLAGRAIAVTAVSESLAPDALADARSLAEERGWRHEEIVTREIERPEYRRNAPDRCFQCKDELFDALGPLVARFGVAAVAVGTNADDLGDFRPGQRAAALHGVRTPLADAGLTKAEIREASRARGLRSWDKPAAPCLASRVAYGVEVTPDRLRRIGEAEAFVRSLGFRDLRVRDHGEGVARIEVLLEDVPRLASGPLRDWVVSGLKQIGFGEVSVDPGGLRSGSMNVVLGLPARRPS